mgnify:CR=1 FL=1
MMSDVALKRVPSKGYFGTLHYLSIYGESWAESSFLVIYDLD